jgi:hypothetical protein
MFLLFDSNNIIFERSFQTKPEDDQRNQDPIKDEIDGKRFGLGLGLKNGYVDMSLFFQDPSRAKKCKEKQHVFTEFY